MPQEIRVLKCFKCDIFQGDIVKKAKTWQCKICGEKQSVMQEFGKGTGKECRQHIQKLNMKMRDENNLIAIKLQNDIDFYEPIAENVENLSKEQLMLPLLVKSNLSNFNTVQDDENIYDDNFFPINSNNTVTNNLSYDRTNEDSRKNINSLIAEPLPSTVTTTNSPLNKYLNIEKNLKRNSRENAGNLTKKSKWTNYLNETDNE